jgi:uncharacterized membrane protein YfcA
MLTALALLAISAVYASVGQAGGTGFLAVMAVSGVPVDQLRPTALAMNVVAAAYTTWRLQSEGAIAWPRLTALAGPALPLAFAGGLVALSPGVYTFLTGALLLVAAILMVARPGAASWAAAASRPASMAGWMAIGATAGLLSGLSGIGGGVFVAPALVVLGWAGPREAAGLSAPFILGNSILGLAGALLSGQQFAPHLAWFAGAALLGAAVGSAFTRRLSDGVIRLVLAAIVAIAGFRLLSR